MRPPLVLLVLLAALPAAGQRPATPFQPAFAADAIDWANTAEFPANPNGKLFAASREDQILRCLGVVTPGSSHGTWVAGPRDKADPGLERLAFKAPVAIGTILQGAGIGGPLAAFPDTAIALLKPVAAYPGDVADDAQWQPLTPQLPRRGAGVYVLPSGTKVRAIRFRGPVAATHFLAGRLVDLSQAAQVMVSHGDPVALQQGRNWWLKLPDDITPGRPAWAVYAWDRPQTVRGLVLFTPTFARYRLEAYTGGAGSDPLAAPPAAWKVLRDDAVTPPWRWFHDQVVELPEPVTTTAIRLVVTQPFVAENPDIASWTGNTAKCCGLSGLAVLSDLGDRPLPVAAQPAAPPAHPPIPIRFTLKEPASVTLVIEDQQGRRLRNLVADTPFSAGAHTAWWDGMDEHKWRIIHIPGVALYPEISGNLLTPGTYRVRGLTHRQVDLRYEFSLYSGNGSVPWHTADGKGAWLADHTPPSACLFLPGDPPQVLLSSFIAECGDGLVWAGLDGKRRSGVRGIGAGGGWWGADYLARDPADGAAYLTGAWETALEVWQIGPNRKVLSHTFADKEHTAAGGLAARNGLLVASLTKTNQLLFADAKTGKEYGTAPLDSPRGLAFDGEGRLLALSGTKLLRLTLPAPADGMQPGARDELVGTGLEDPQGITLDPAGNLYVSDWGESHQVEVFSPAGKLLRSIGQPGAPRVGPYDETHMQSPKGLAVSPDGHLWVAENSFHPKRISIWTLDGRFVQAIYGPAGYGGGGSIDPEDPTRFFLGHTGGMEFKLDWQKGTGRLVNLYYLPGQTGVALAGGGWSGVPQVPIHHDGRLYLTSNYVSHPTNAEAIGALWIWRDGRAVPVAALGDAAQWPLLGEPPFAATKPAGKLALFCWCDRNDDAQVQPEEVQFKEAVVGGVTVQGDLAMVTSTAQRYAPVGWTKLGAPLYDLARGTTLAPGARPAGTSGGGGLIAGRDGWTVFTWPPEPFPGGYLAGARNGKLLWSYAEPYLGLHNSAIAPLPRSRGDVIGTTRLLGLPVTPPGTREELWAINGNYGNIFVFTTDGLLVTTLFRDSRVTGYDDAWAAVKSERRGMLVNQVSLQQECFFPTINQLRDGRIYLMAGKNFSSLVEVRGLGSIARLPAFDLPVSAAQLEACRGYFAGVEAARQGNEGRPTLTVPLRAEAPVVDGKLDEWPSGYFVKLDDQAQAAVAIAGDRLYAAYRTGDPRLLTNTAALPVQLFKTGGALDLMLGTDPQADPERKQPVPGDLRLLVTLAGGEPLAMLYRPVVPGTREPVVFRSWHAISIDRVDDVSDAVQLAGSGGDYELSIPLAALGLKPAAGMVLRGDVGLLRGDGVLTTQRVYWSNKGTGITSDVPSEAALEPAAWGRWWVVGG